jgi:hypothetical protein
MSLSSPNMLLSPKREQFAGRLPRQRHATFILENYTMALISEPCRAT